MPRNLDEAALSGSRVVTRRSDRFLTGLADFRSVTLVSHIHPDPDSLGSMVGLAHLIDHKLGLPVRMTQDGQIGRAENRAMVDCLDIDLVPIRAIRWSDKNAVVMVDSQPKTGRHSFNGEANLWAVIDHHQTCGDIDDIPFLDIRRGLGATCSLVTRYLLEQEVDVSDRVATCLYYGIESELSGFPREASPIDDSALQFLYPLANKDMVARIRNAPLPDGFYEALLQALQSSFIYDKLLISWISELSHPELASQVVDFLVRHEEIHWAVCAGIYDEQLVLSMRSNQPRAHAGELLRAVAARMGGKAGGHDRRAGGFIPLPSNAPSAVEQVQGEFRRRLLRALHIEETRGRRLVSRREMLQNLAV